MIYVDTNDSSLTAVACKEEIALGSGNFAYRLDGEGEAYLSLNIFTGKLEARPSVGPWETFKKSSTALVLDLVWEGNRYVFIRPYVEVK